MDTANIENEILQTHFYPPPPPMGVSILLITIMTTTLYTILAEHVFGNSSERLEAIQNNYWKTAPPLISFKY